MATDVDLLAGMSRRSMAPRLDRAPVILVFDSGVGGLTVHAEIIRALPAASCIYVGDDAGFPYGEWAEPALVARIVALFEQLLRRYEPDLAVIACNTASTLVLPHLRARFAIPFVGAVPAVKPAAEKSRSRVIAVLATPGTVRRDYTRDLVRAYAGDCRVEFVGSARLASLAERELRGEILSDTDIYDEISPCFVSDSEDRRTDTVVLACTHYPLLIERFLRVAPWPVEWIDPAPAIARRAASLLGGCGGDGEPGRNIAVFTGAAVESVAIARALSTRGFTSAGRFRPCSDS